MKPRGKRGRFRPLARLLDAQPRGLVRDPRHRLLWDHFLASETLQRLRISPRCYRILNEATIEPEHLADFYTTYRLPDHPFFPLFLAVKAEWLEQRRRWREKRDAEIFARVKQLPDHRRRSLRLLAEYERMHHPNADNPIWDNRLFPQSKKRAEEFMGYGETEWFGEWCRHLERLANRYRDIPALFDGFGNPTYSFKVLAVLVLRCREVTRREVTRNFRFLSKEFHPDYGGSPESFRRLKTARDVLLDEGAYLNSR